MASLKGTQTHKNLMRAFAGESQARNRYNLYEGIARKQGYPLVADVFKLMLLIQSTYIKRTR